jgi:hypothetical protein
MQFKTTSLKHRAGLCLEPVSNATMFFTYKFSYNILYLAAFVKIKNHGNVSRDNIQEI